jgi:voltage-gated potassium channel Kch
MTSAVGKIVKPLLNVARNIRTFAAQNRARTLRQNIFSLLNPTPQSHNLNKYVEYLVVTCVLISVVCIILETVQEIDSLWSQEFKTLDLLTVVIFSIEYVLRVYSCSELEPYKHPIKGRLKYMFTPSALIDLLAISPFYISLYANKTYDLRFLRIFRLTRLLKLTRYTGTLNTLMKAVQREKYVLMAAAFMMILMIVLTASLGYMFEHDSQPDKFESIPTSMYWAVITLASVGYGDITPITPLGRLMTVVVSFVGIGIFAIPAGLMASSFTDQLRLDRKTFEDEVRKLVTSDQFTDEQRRDLELEAERLHLSKEVIEEIITRIDLDKNSSVSDEPEIGSVSIELSLENFRKEVNSLRRVALSPQAHLLTALIEDTSKTTQLERDIWQKLSS